MTGAEAHEDAVALMVRHPLFERLKETVATSAGLHYSSESDTTLAERAERHRGALRCSLNDYFMRVLDKGDTREFAALIEHLTVGETYFFRYPHQFSALQQTILPACLKSRAPGSALRIWSAGCASGAEPYSLSILLRDGGAGTMAGIHHSILATDINRTALATACAGLYGSWELRSTPAEQRLRWFDEINTSWRIRSEFRQGVEFAYQNLVADIDEFARAHAGTFDIILCRNVMIYFSPAAMRRLLLRLNQCLTDGGWLLVGHAEPYFELANFFVPEPAAGAGIYRKSSTPSSTAQEPFRELPAYRWSHDPECRELAEPWTVPATVPPTDSAASETLPQIPSSPADHIDALAAVRRHWSAGRWDAARSACDDGLRTHPMDTALHYARALICEHTGGAVEAEQSLRQALYLDRRFALAHYHLGRLLSARGDRKSAARAFANALNIVASRDEAECVTMGEGMTAADLRDLARIQIGLLERAK